MTDNNKSDPRKIHIGPVDRPKEDDFTNVVHLPTEVIDHKSEDTWFLDQVEGAEPKSGVRAVVQKCRTALKSSKIKADVETPSTSDVRERHTISSDILRHRQIREKCYTIREIVITVLTIVFAVNMVIFMGWLQFILYSWSH